MVAIRSYFKRWSLKVSCEVKIALACTKMLAFGKATSEYFQNLGRWVSDWSLLCSTGNKKLKYNNILNGFLLQIVPELFLSFTNHITRMRQSAASPVSSYVSKKSNDSIHQPPNLSNGTATSNTRCDIVSSWN